MSTLNIVTTDVLTTNRTRINLYREPDRIAVVDSLVFAAPHGRRNWTFYNLEPSQAYYFQWTEIDGSDLDIQVYADAVFTTPAAGSVEVKAYQEITTDVTVGWPGGVTTITMDGTAGKDDWRTWDIHLEKVGFGSQFKLSDEDYTWNNVTGVLTLTVATSPVEKYYVEFVDKVVASGTPTTNYPFTGIRVITTNEAILTADFGRNLILIQGSSPFLTASLPDILTVPEFRPLYIKSDRLSHINAEILSTNANAIDWLEGNRTSLYIGLCESLVIYRSGTMWKVLNSDGNFKSVGEMFTSYAEEADILNAIETDGREIHFQDYSRIYIDHVLKQPTGNIVAYSVWPTGNNKYKYSLKDPVSGLFHIPDLRDITARNMDAAGNPGDFLATQNLKHGHAIDTSNSLGSNSSLADPIRATVPGSPNAKGAECPTDGDDTNYTIKLSGGDEARPNQYKERRFVRT